MNNYYYKRSNCRYCGDKKIEKIISLPSLPFGDLYLKKPFKIKKHNKCPTSLYFCNNCKSVQLIHMIYSKNIYGKFIYESKVTKNLINHFNDLKKSIIGTMYNKVYEIGANDGSLLKLFKKNNYVVAGVDPAKLITKKNETQLNIDTNYFSSEYSQKVLLKFGYFDLVISNYTFANIDNLHDIIIGMTNILSPQGIIIIETSYLLDVKKKYLWDTFFHEHLSYFTIKNLFFLFKKFDLELYDFNRIMPKGGSIRCLFKRNKNISKPNSKINKQINIEIKEGLFRKNTYRQLDIYLRGASLDLKKFLKINKLNKLVGYGASVASTTFIFYNKFLLKYIDFIIDDNILISNTYMPGTKIKVISGGSFSSLGLDSKYILIIAWRYSKMIISKNIKLIKSGFSFIVPFPNILIINDKNYKKFLKNYDITKPV